MEQETSSNPQDLESEKEEPHICWEQEGTEQALKCAPGPPHADPGQLYWGKVRLGL